MLKELAVVAVFVAASVSVSAQSCTRDGLKAMIANYFKAVETHNMSALPTAANLRINQNGQEMKTGEGQ